MMRVVGLFGGLLMCFVLIRGFEDGKEQGILEDGVSSSAYAFLHTVDFAGLRFSSGVRTKQEGLPGV